MPIQAACPQCRTAFRADDNLAGRIIWCKQCGASIVVPSTPVAAVPRGPANPPKAPKPPKPPANPPKPPANPPKVPKKIDRYEVRELLGAGAFGSVYRAFDPRLQRDVALKVLRPEATASTEAVERFLREAQAAARLHHPHIVPVHDTGHSGGVYFIASALIKGRQLAAAVPPGGMDPRRAAELTAQLASALAYAHKQGILHRDVKPQNTLLDEEGALHLVDFGLARWSDEDATRLTQVGGMLGTPAYMAPEQAAGDAARLGPATDLYGAGAVLYHLLTGRPPFEGGQLATLVYRIVHTEPAPPSRWRPGLDAGLEAICLKALAKDPARRYGSGDEMATALRRWAPMATPMTMETAPLSPSPSGWDAETILPTAPQPDTPQRRVADRKPARRAGSSLSWLLWGCVSLVLTAGLGGAAAMLYWFPPGTNGASAGGGTKTDASTKPLSSKPDPPTPLPPAKADPVKPENLQDDVVNTFGGRLKRIQPGQFLMGSPPGEAGQFDNETPQNPVEITRPFYLGVYPVTQAEYIRTTGKKNPSWFSAEGGGKEEVKDLVVDNFPVETVSWYEAVACCEALNKQDAKRPAGWKYGLPTEAQWEYACRAGTTTAYSFGDDPANLGHYAWYGGDNENSGKRPHVVGMLGANPWGLYDLHGNVFQWCADGPRDYPQDPVKGPLQNPVGPDAGGVLRGGSWDYDPRRCRSAYRFKVTRDYKESFVGFRIGLFQDR